MSLELILEERLILYFQHYEMIFKKGFSSTMSSNLYTMQRRITTDPFPHSF